MESLVVDSNVLVSSFLEADTFHQESQIFVSDLNSGRFMAHLSMLTKVEVLSAILRRGLQNRVALLARVEKSLRDWGNSSKTVLYPLNVARMDRAVPIATRMRLRGADSVIAAFAEELDLPLKTFDQEIIGRFPRATP